MGDWKKTKGKEEWINGLYRIVKKFRYFVIFFNGKKIGQESKLQDAKNITL